MKYFGCPSGVPDVLFTDPGIAAFQKQGEQVDVAIWGNCYQLHKTEFPDCDTSFAEWALQQLLYQNLQIPSTMNDGMSLFSTLIDICQI